jgi:hypothetical protein
MMRLRPNDREEPTARPVKIVLLIAALAGRVKSAAIGRLENQ